MQQIHISSREARAKWRDLLDLIQNSEHEIIIERYGKPVGKLVPFKEEQAETAVSLKEASLVYQTAVSLADPMNTQLPLRTQLKQQLDQLTHNGLLLVEQFLKLLGRSQDGPSYQATQPVPAHVATEWVGLLDEGYDGDALADSEALYE